MNLLTQKQFAELAGVSSPAIGQARKKKRLEHYQGTKEYDTDSPLNRAFLETIPKERLNKPAVIPPKNGEVSPEIGANLGEAITEVQHAHAKKLIEEAELKKQQRIEKELKNAVRRGELVELEKINQSLMMYIDRWHNENERGWKAKYQELKRLIQKVSDGQASDNEVRKIFSDWFMERTHIAKTETVRRLQEITIEQGRK